jgi:hypothetical protein
MLRGIVTFLLLKSLIWGQSLTANAPDQASAPPAQSSTAMVPDRPALMVSVYQRYSAVRRGGEQEIAVVICMANAHSRYCPDYGSSIRSDIAPISFQFSPSPGYTVSYWARDEYRVQSSGIPIHAGDKEIVLLKLRTSNNLPLGRQTLEGNLTLRVGDSGPGGVWSNNGVLKEVAVKIPLTIVARNAAIQEVSNWPTPRDAARNLKQGLAGIVRAAPPLAWFWAFCHVDFHADSCDPRNF